MKLGHIDYLNSYPFYYQMLEKNPLKGVRIFSGLPSALNRMMTEEKLDLSPISSATCADISDDIWVLPQFCLSSIGYVGSVILISKVPIEDLGGRRIGLTSASHTSVVVLKILMERYYRLQPVYVPADPRPTLGDLDAALVIGNEAMIRTSRPAAYTYDLGDLWLRKTGNPVVFAVFAVRRSMARIRTDGVREVIESFRQSLRSLQEEKQEVIRKAKKRYPDILYDIDGYYDLLKFEFTEELKRALMFYFETAAELGLVKEVTQLNYFRSQ